MGFVSAGDCREVIAGADEAVLRFSRETCFFPCFEVHPRYCLCAQSRFACAALPYARGSGHRLHGRLTMALRRC
jgi:hypothetical protein